MKLGLIAALLLVGCSGPSIASEVDADVAVDAGSDTKPYNGCTETCDGICTCPDDAMNCVSLCGESAKHCMPFIPNGEGCPSGYDCTNNACKAVEPALPACEGLCNEQCSCGNQTCQQHCGGVWLCEDPGYLIDGCQVGYACINPEGCVKNGTRL
jgi:hypothetical protein